MKKAPMQKEKQPHNHHQHSQKGQREHPLTAFFGCCLGDEPAPISPKIQELRSHLTDQTTIEEIQLQPGQKLKITSDMIVGDILANFPQTRPFFEELHPLGLMSPVLANISLELFFSDLNLNLEQICDQLTQITEPKN